MKKQFVSALSMAVVSALAIAAQAQQINPATVALDRLKQTAANRTADGYQLKSIKLKGDLNTDGIKFTLPTVVPEKPLVLMQQRIANCNDREVTGRATVNKSTENSETFSKSTTLGGETSVTVSYESPIGVSGSATQSFNYSKTSTEEKTHSETVGWDSGIDVPVGPKQSLTVQFVVAEQKMDNIPWSTNVILSGPVELNYEKAPGTVKVCAYEHSGYGGKKKCWSTSSRLAVGKFKDVGWESGKGDLNDDITGFTIEGNAKVTFYQHHDYKGWAAEYTASNSNVGKDRNDEFSSVVIEPLGSTKTVTEDIGKYLNDQQRRIALSGRYKGVNGVQGDFRAGAPVQLTSSDCGLVTQGGQVAAASGPSAARAPAGAAASVSAPQPRVATAASVQAAPVSEATPVIQGKVLQSGVKPASKQVTVTSVKKS